MRQTDTGLVKSNVSSHFFSLTPPHPSTLILFFFVTMTSRRTYYLSVDIETMGPRYSDTVNAIGMAFGPADGSWRKLRTLRYSVKAEPMETTDQQTFQNFWIHHPELLREITDTAVSAPYALVRIMSFVQQLVASYEDGSGSGSDGEDKEQATIVLVTDCPDFDLGRLDFLLKKHKICDRPLRWLGSPRRHAVMDPRERLEALGPSCVKACATWIKKTRPGVVHDHRPEHDAEYTYWQAVWLNSFQHLWQPTVGAIAARTLVTV